MLKHSKTLIAITSLALSSCIDLYYHGADSELEYYSDIKNGVQYFVENPKDIKINVFLDEDSYKEMFTIRGYQTDVSSATKILKELECHHINSSEEPATFHSVFRFEAKIAIIIWISFDKNCNILSYSRTPNHKGLARNAGYLDYYAINPDEGKRLKDAVWDIALKSKESSSESDSSAGETMDSSPTESAEEASDEDAGGSR